MVALISKVERFENNRSKGDYLFGLDDSREHIHLYGTGKQPATVTEAVGLYLAEFPFLRYDGDRLANTEWEITFDNGTKERYVQVLTFERVVEWKL